MAAVVDRAQLDRARADALCDHTDIRELSGMETWFALPGAGGLGAPPRWKMALVSWLVAFPLIQGLNASLGAWLTSLPAPLRGAAVGLALIALMTFVAMPLVSRALASWLYPRRPEA